MLQEAHRHRWNLHCWGWYHCLFRLPSTSYHKAFLRDSSSQVLSFRLKFPYEMLIPGLIFEENGRKSGPSISKNRLEERSYFTNVKKKIVSFLKSSSKFSAFKGLKFWWEGKEKVPFMSHADFCHTCENLDRSQAFGKTAIYTCSTETS